MNSTSFALARLLTFALLFGADAFAEAPIKVFTRTRQIPERGGVLEDVVWSRTHELSVTTPSGWGDEVSTNGLEIAFNPRDPGISISIRLAEGPSQLPLRDPAQLRDRIAAKFPGGRIIAESECYAAGTRGLAVDLTYVVADKFVRNARVAIIPMAGGVLDCELACPAESFDQLTHQFGLVLNSVRVKAR